MTCRYEQTFANLRQKNEKAFIPFTMLGWPNKQYCLSFIKDMIDAGASALELGMAFSDPIADGPVIQKSAHEVIQSGFTVHNAFELVKNVRQMSYEIPIGLLVYYNTVLSQGIENFYSQARAAGVDSVLIADLPCESAHEVMKSAWRENIAQIFIVSPLTTASRLDKILQYAQAYLYVASRLGVTGVEDRYDHKLSSVIALIREKIDLPVCVGFGVSTPEQAKKMCALGVDGVIPGSYLIELISSAMSACQRGKHPGYLLQPYLDSMVKTVGRGTQSAVLG